MNLGLEELIGLVIGMFIVSTLIKGAGKLVKLVVTIGAIIAIALITGLI